LMEARNIRAGCRWWMTSAFLGILQSRVAVGGTAFELRKRSQMSGRY
jgi:hypothetical protein